MVPASPTISEFLPLVGLHSAGSLLATLDCGLAVSGILWAGVASDECDPATLLLVGLCSGEGSLVTLESYWLASEKCSRVVS